MDASLTIEEIKQKYPNEWVLLGNPVIDNKKVLSGIPIYHAKDKREIAYQGINWRESFSGAIIVYTGEFAKNRRFSSIENLNFQLTKTIM